MTIDRELEDTARNFTVFVLCGGVRYTAKWSVEIHCEAQGAPIPGRRYTDQQGAVRLHQLEPKRMEDWPRLAAMHRARLYLIDSKPIPLYVPIWQRQLLCDEGTYYGKSSKEEFFGFKFHLLRHISGHVLNLVLTPGNTYDRDSTPALIKLIDAGVTLGDLGYRRPESGREYGQRGCHTAHYARACSGP